MSDHALYEPLPPEIALPPNQDELLCDDGIPMKTHRHKLQMDLLVDPLIAWLVLEQGRGFVGGNMFVYFSPSQVRNQDYRGPDVFVVLDVPVGERKSWVVWEEEKGPDMVIELLSDSTAERDKGEKKQIYQSQLRTPEYFGFDPFNPIDLAGFSLQRGVYEPIQPDSDGNLVSQQIELMLTRWRGSFKGVETTWLHWSTLDGVLLLTAQEQAALVQQQADDERHRAENERQRAERLAARLKELGIDPATI